MLGERRAFAGPRTFRPEDAPGSVEQDRDGEKNHMEEQDAQQGGQRERHGQSPTLAAYRLRDDGEEQCGTGHAEEQRFQGEPRRDHYQPITMFDSMTFRDRSRSSPVACM